MSLKVTAEAVEGKSGRIVLKLTRSMRAGLVVATVPETMGFKIGPVTRRSTRTTPVTGTANYKVSRALARVTLHTGGRLKLAVSSTPLAIAGILP